MENSNLNERRLFLKQGVGTLVGASSLLGSGSFQGNAAEQLPATTDTIPPHRAIPVPGLHAYAERSVSAGDTLSFRTSSTVNYRLSICRLAGEVDDVESDVVLHLFDESAPKAQPIHPGSYIHVDQAFPTTQSLDSLTLECWVRPWQLNSHQGLMTQDDFPNQCGLGLFIHPGGQVALYLGNGDEHQADRMFVGGKLNHRRWNHIAGTWDGERVVLWVNGRKAGSWELSGTVRFGDTAFRLGASGVQGLADRFLEGDLAMPTLYRHSLSAEEIRERIDTRGLQTPASENVLACWPFTEENGDQTADIGSGKRTGRIINHATWMIGGPSFKGDDVGRYDTSYSPADDKRRGHGIRFASDDLYDCHWDITHEFQIPKDAPSGVYVGRYDFQIDGKAHQYQVTFNVRRPASRPKASILVLLSTSTWNAYNSAAFPVPMQEGLQTVGTGGLANSHPKAPAYSCYRDHHHGQPAYYFGTRMPWPAASPAWLYLAPELRYSHLMRTELFLHRWLDGVYGDHDGYDYDVVTDYDLHCNPEMLNGYKTLCINGHSEYWSAEAYEGVEHFLADGGTVIALSGNTMFWRTTFNEDGSVMECRKYDPRIGGRGGAVIGELYHSDDQRRGSLMRECGYPAWKCIGLDCSGWAGVDGVYHADLPDHFLMKEPEDASLSRDETFGHGPQKSQPWAVGHEWDVRVSTLAKVTRNIPAGATLPEEPEGIVTLARGVRPGGATLDYFTQNTSSQDGVCAEVIYWERPTGGRVFHAGTIAAGAVLSVDPKWQTVMRNVLHHFGAKPKQPQPKGESAHSDLRKESQQA